MEEDLQLHCDSSLHPLWKGLCLPGRQHASFRSCSPLGRGTWCGESEHAACVSWLVGEAAGASCPCVSALRANGDFLTFDDPQVLWGCLEAAEETRMWVQRPGVALSAGGGWSGTAQELILQLLLQRCSTSVPARAAGAGDNDSCYGHSPTFHVERQGSHGTETGMGHLCPFYFCCCRLALRALPLAFSPESSEETGKSSAGTALALLGASLQGVCS